MASNFFEYQTKARNRTLLLIFLYALAVVGTIVFTYVVLAVTIAIASEKASVGYEFLDWNRFALVAGVTGAIILLASFFKMLQLGSSGSKIAEMLGGRLLNKASATTEEKRLLNIVEEMAVAAGVRIPEVYMLDQEESINAFAAGPAPEQAVIGVSRGALHFLKRDELQGVIAHEFSHIVNYDTRLDMRLAGVLYGIVMLVTIGQVIVRASSSSRRSYSSSKKNSGGGFIAIGLGLIVAGAIGAFFATLIKMAVSRQREFLADASAVQFTRNPDGITGALKKIGGLQAGSQIESPHTDEVSHIFFSDAVKHFLGAKLFSTHPALTERITRFDPHFDGTFPVIELASDAPESAATSSGRSPSVVDAFSSPERIMQTVGALLPQALEQTQAAMAHLPAALSMAVTQTRSAELTVCSLFSRGQEVEAVISRTYPEQINEYQKLQQLTVSRDLKEKFLLCELSLPALRQQTPEEYKIFLNVLKELIELDQNYTLFEYCFLKAIKSVLDQEILKQPAPAPVRNLATLVAPASDLLYTLAFLGNADVETSRQSYLTACQQCGIDAAYQQTSQQKQPELSLLEDALSRTSTADLPIRKKIFEACLTCIQTDNQISPDEFMLIKTIAVIFRFPLPALV